MRTRPWTALRHVAFASFVCLLAGIILVAPGCRKRSTPSVEGLPTGTFDRLTEDDISRIVAVGPAMRKLVWNSGMQPEHVKMTDGVPQYLTKMIDWMHDVPGVDSVLATAGLTWPTYRVILYRVFITAISLGAPEALRNAEGIMGTLSVGERKNLRRQIAQTKRIVEHVPQENKDTFTRHRRELAECVPGSSE